MDKPTRFSDEAYKLAAVAAKFWETEPRERIEGDSSFKSAAEWALDILLACEEALAK